MCYLVLFVLLAGKFVTGEWSWGAAAQGGSLGAWANVRSWWPAQQRLFSERLLGQFDGTVSDKPIYLAVRMFFLLGHSSGPLCVCGVMSCRVVLCRVMGFELWVRL
jgi:hypothetical protein